MRKKNTNEQLHTQPQFRLKPVYAAVLLAFAVQTAQANPIGGTVAAGQASFATAGNTLNVTNTPGTIINWQGFSIGANEITHFVQQSASSAVLNRVISNNPSSILGTLQSNGRVFLINPGGIVFGAGATVDVAGMVASTLNLSNADFLAGRNHFTQVPGSANVSNAGNITAQNGGQIYLIAPDVENTGVITAPNGEILLAAGHSVDLVSTTNPNLRVNITAPAGDATNVGQLIAQSGSLGLFGTVVRNSGTVNADSATMQGGKIVFKASLRVEAGGTITANGTNGGSVDVSAAHSLDPNAPGVVIQTGSIQAQGTAGAGGAVSLSGDSILSAAAINADGTTAGGRISVQANNRALSTVAAQYTTDSTLGAGGDILVSADVSNYTSGSYSATGTTGGNLALAGNEIKLAGAQLDASGTNGGGNIYIGGLMHGAAGFSAQGIALTNATNVLTNSATSLKADALQTGNGGEVVLWSDQAMSFKGNISAKGGVLGGNGGMAEISGLTSLGYNGLTDLSATNGLNGTLLLDPRNITIVAGPGALAGAASPSVLELIDPNPGAGYGFGGSMTELANGNIAIASPNDGFVAANAGAVFLYSPAGSLLSTLTGSAVNDNVGSGGITQLAINGNFVVVSPNWGAGVSTTPLGAVTWGSATAGVSGTVSPANSVVGTLANDQVGRGYSGAPVVALTNGNYVVTSPFWNSTAGAATWVDGTTGHVSDYAANGNTNVISSANSLVGVPGDFVGVKVIALPINGNYVVGGSSAGTATATWVNGTNGQTSDASNTISLANSLMGASQPYALTNGNYVVVNGFYAGSGSQRGVATWVNGTTGLTSDGLNVISAANSIIGQTNNDMIGQNGVIALPNGNYVLANFDWNYTSGYGGWGAVTWVNGSTGKTSNGLNVISQSNSVVGNNTGEQVGAKVVVLTNGNYVIGSYNWPGYGTSAGAATWVNGSTGLTKDGLGVISSANSWLGVNPYDMVGFNITALSNGNYVVGSPFWNGNRGAVTWGDGATGSVGFVGLTNSLVGSAPSDYVGASGYLGGNIRAARGKLRCWEWLLECLCGRGHLG
jgi:filamentous hemagglutinin family protein